MQSKPKANSIVTSRIPEDAGTFTITLEIPTRMVFEVRDNGDVPFDLTAVSAANHARALVHGWNQRIPDAAAVGTTDKDGAIIPKAERTRIKKERMNDLCVHYESGTEEWTRRGDGTGASVGLVIEAIMRVKEFTRERAELVAQQHADMHFGGDRKKALAHLATGKRIAEAMLAIKNERLMASLGDDIPDADAMLDEAAAEAEAETDADAE